MTANTLQQVQATLEQRGVRDVKFLFKRESLAVPMSDLADDAANVLAQFLSGKNCQVVNELPSEELTVAN